MPAYQLYNLDLGENPAIRTFQVGPFTIALVNDYDDIQKHLSALPSEENKFDSSSGSIIRTKTYRPAIVGEALITATASCDIEGDALLIKDETSSSPEEDALLSTDLTPTISDGDTKPVNETTPEIWDLCVIFSYLTGRRVYTEDEKRRFSHIHHGFGVVQPSDIIKAANRAWDNRSNFNTYEKLIPLWLYLHINDTSEIQLKLLIGCVILELITNLEVTFTSNIPDELKNCIDVVKKTIQNSSLAKDTKGKFTSTVSHWGEKSLNEAFRELFFNYDLTPMTVTGDMKKRVDAISSYRNSIVHAGKLKELDWIKNSSKKKYLPFFYGGQFNVALIQEYINRKLGIDTDFYWPMQSHDNLKEYLETGFWNNENQEA